MAYISLKCHTSKSYFFFVQKLIESSEVFVQKQVKQIQFWKLWDFFSLKAEILFSIY